MPEMGKEKMDNLFHGRVFRESRLRDAIGPSNPLYHLMRSLTVDMYVFQEEWEYLNASIWTAGGASSTNWATTANQPGGLLGATTDATDTDDCSMLSLLNYAANRRPTALFRVGTGGVITTYKLEAGFTDQEDAATGAVNVKTTPTTIATDCAVAIFDTDDATNTGIDLVTDGGTDDATLTVGVPNVTVAISTEYNLMVAIDELRSVRYWINNVYQGRSAAGPDATAALGLYLCLLPRADSARSATCEYVKAWQERETQA